eukprot:4653472-Amphidinium_carterae.3
MKVREGKLEAGENRLEETLEMARVKHRLEGREAVERTAGSKNTASGKLPELPIPPRVRAQDFEGWRPTSQSNDSRKKSTVCIVPASGGDGGEPSSSDTSSSSPSSSDESAVPEQFGKDSNLISHAKGGSRTVSLPQVRRSSGGAGGGSYRGHRGGC